MLLVGVVKGDPTALSTSAASEIGDTPTTVSSTGLTRSNVAALCGGGTNSLLMKLCGTSSSFTARRTPLPTHGRDLQHMIVAIMELVGFLVPWTQWLRMPSFFRHCVYLLAGSDPLLIPQLRRHRWMLRRGF